MATAGPDGDATAPEAASPALAFYAARLAFDTGRIELGDRFAAVVSDSGQRAWVAQTAAVRAQAVGEDPQEQARLWREVLTNRLDDGSRLVALHALAGLGCWPLPDLDEMNAAGRLSEGMYLTLHAKSLAASGDKDQALILLRGGQDANPIVAEAYALLLAELGKIEDCLQACDQATLRFGDPRLSLLELDVLTRADRVDEVISRATDLLSRSDLPFSLRHRVRGNLINALTGRQDWPGCEKLGVLGLMEAKRLEISSE